MMQLEVEQKYPLLQRAELVAALDSLGCRWEPPIAQSDLYFAHPARNFKQTDEALRLRRSGDEVMITYKGPKLDTTTKTRRELELPIAGGAGGFDQYRELLEVLGFQSVREVRKLRQPGSVRWQGEEIQIALDDVEDLGSFVELELLVAPAQLSAAQNHLASLAQRLQLTAPERRGYLDLLLHGK
jgi:adenylate cyclase class 2